MDKILENNGFEHFSVQIDGKQFEGLEGYLIPSAGIGHNSGKVSEGALAEAAVGRSTVLHLTGHVARRVRLLPAGYREIIFWDAALSGFGLRVRKGGSRSWMVQYRVRGRLRKKSLGSVTQMPCSDARHGARKLLLAARLSSLPQPAVQRKGRRFTDVAADYLAHNQRRWKPATISKNAALVHRELLPVFGECSVADINKADVQRWRDAMGRRSGVANRTIPVLSGIFCHAELMQDRAPGSNPAKGLPRFKRQLPERYLTSAEYARLHHGLRLLCDQIVADILRLLALTGARLSEIALLRWAWIKDGWIDLPDSKTGPRRIYLCAAATNLLARHKQGRPQRQSAERATGALPDYVFVRTCPSALMRSVTQFWLRLRKSVGLEDVRLHDLRHSFASSAISCKEPLSLIGGLLGHALPETTARYAHLAEDSVHEAANRIGGALWQMVTGQTATCATGAQGGTL